MADYGCLPGDYVSTPSYGSIPSATSVPSGYGSLPSAASACHASEVTAIVDQSKITRLVPLQNNNEDKPLLAVVVTLRSGGSYDQLFTTKAQIVDGGRVAVYYVPYNTEKDLDTIRRGARGSQSSSGHMEQLNEIFRDISQVPNDAVVFNFECCGGCSDRGVNGGSAVNKAFVKLIRTLLNKEYMVMVSDFSLKALIAAWDTDLLGPKAFVNSGTASSQLLLHFSAGQLKECPSAQLRAVGRLCEDGVAETHAMGGTIVFTEAPKAGKSSEYTLDVLTIVEKADGQPTAERFRTANLSNIGGKRGTLGHAVLHYKSGGVLLASAGHWMELSQLKTKESNVWQQMKHQYGAEYAQQAQEEYGALPLSQQAAQLQSYAACAVQQAVPCNYGSLPC